MTWFKKHSGSKKSKFLGWGVPIKWQGYIILIAWLILVIGSAIYFEIPGRNGSLQNGLKFVAVFIVFTAIFYLIAKWKTEK
ncbi:hypothetical protein KY336_01195 [Candidatus Woesearchaeota archaeon]|nr:hypothetical protein [Candidatus Woesearchaeota archaeon]